jgi:hypothetical protein
MKLTTKQYTDGILQWHNAGKPGRLGQFLVNLYGEPGKSYPELFYCDNRDVKLWVEILDTERF